MIELHTEILKKGRKNEFAIMDYKDYQRLMSYIEDLEDLVDLRKAKEESKNEISITLEEVKKQLGT